MSCSHTDLFISSNCKNYQIMANLLVILTVITIFALASGNNHEGNTKCLNLCKKLKSDCIKDIDDKSSSQLAEQVLQKIFKCRKRKYTCKKLCERLYGD